MVSSLCYGIFGGRRAEEIFMERVVLGEGVLEAHFITSIWASCNNLFSDLYLFRD